MATYIVNTCRNETGARPSSEYMVTDVNSEREAIDAVCSGDLARFSYIKQLTQYSIPDYTCAFEIAQAALALCKKMDWKGDLIGGEQETFKG